MKDFNKIFGVGLSKTGTFSLTYALEELGINTLHHAKEVRQVIKQEREEGKKILSTLSEYDAFTDNPIPNHFQELDEEYPNSLFILTYRDMGDWVLSKYKWWTSKPNEYKDDHPFIVEDQKRHFRKHKANVLEYFADRPDDLLTLNICGGEGWEKLCPFLEAEVPDREFPHANTSKPDSEYPGIDEVKEKI